MGEPTTLPIAGPTIGTRDALTDFLRDGVWRLLAQATEAEVAAWVDALAPLNDTAGHR